MAETIPTMAKMKTQKNPAWSATDPPPAEKAKPFRLVKYFTITSLVLIFMGTIILSMLNTHWARTMQRQKSEEYALLILENLNHQVFLQFVMPMVIKYGRIQLRDAEQYERLDKIVRNTLHSFKVETVNIYDMNNVVSYSFNPDLVGKENLGGTGFQKALSGKNVSRQIQQGNLWEILLGIPRESQLITFAPLRAERPPARMSGPVLGVVEIVQDLSDEYQTIFQFQIFIVITSAVVMLVLFLVLIFVVRRGENIIEQRARERLRLKEQLNRAEHLSSLGEMAAVISHEIRNPLGIIRSSADHLKKKMAGVDPANPIPDIIVEETGRLNNIITDFLNYARPRDPSFAPCRVEEVIEKNLSHMANQIKEKGFSVQCDIAEDLPEISADSAMLYQAFLNLLINATQVSENGGNILVRVNSNHADVHVQIEDDGPGVSEDQLQKIWDPFFTTKDKGTGLGLGIVKKIIELHGGSIEIRNRPGGGAQVAIRLPVQQEDPESWKPS